MKKLFYFLPIYWFLMSIFFSLACFYAEGSFIVVLVFGSIINFILGCLELLGFLRDDKYTRS
jgi:hypothetical protein